MIPAVTVASLSLAASLLQLGVLPPLFLERERAPLLPVALLAAWIAVRGPLEAWAALLIVPVAVGAASEERVGWFLLALLPTALAAMALRSGPQSSAQAFVVRAAGAAAAGALLYALTLATAAARFDLSSARFEALVASCLLTALLAAAVALLLLPFRSRPRGLFS